MKIESSTELKRLIKETMTPLNALESISETVDQWSSMLVFFPVSRFDANTRKDWERHLGDSVATPTWEQLMTFMNAQLLTLEAIERGSKANQSISSRAPLQSHKSARDNNPPSHNVNASNQKTSKTNQSDQFCSCCKQSHYIARCDLFKSKPIQERRDLVKQSNLFFNCLGRHRIQACKSDRRCFTCKGKHHTLLHDQTTGAQPSDVLTAHFSTQLSMSPSLNLQQAASASHLTKVPRTIFTQVLLATARVFVEAPNGFRV